MDIIKHFIGFFIKLAFAFFLAASIWWLVSLLFPTLSIKSFVPKNSNKSLSNDWLASPRKYSALFKPPATTTNFQVFVVPPSPNQYVDDQNQNYTYNRYDYLVYTQSGTVVVNGDASNPATKSTTTKQSTSSVLPAKSPVSLSNSVERNRVIRNLSIYEGGHVYTGLSFIGEARSEMFKEGKFPIILVGQNGRVVGVSAAIATTNWTVPGWTRFETKITYPLPSDTPCTVVFEEALTQNEKISRQPLRIPIPVRCN